MGAINSFLKFAGHHTAETLIPVELDIDRDGDKDRLVVERNEDGACTGPIAITYNVLQIEVKHGDLFETIRGNKFDQIKIGDVTYRNGGSFYVLADTQIKNIRTVIEPGRDPSAVSLAIYIDYSDSTKFGNQLGSAKVFSTNIPSGDLQTYGEKIAGLVKQYNSTPTSNRAFLDEALALSAKTQYPMAQKAIIYLAIQEKNPARAQEIMSGMQTEIAKLDVPQQVARSLSLAVQLAYDKPSEPVEAQAVSLMEGVIEQLAQLTDAEAVQQSTTSLGSLVARLSPAQVEAQVRLFDKLVQVILDHPSLDDRKKYSALLDLARSVVAVPALKEQVKKVGDKLFEALKKDSSLAGYNTAFLFHSLNDPAKALETLKIKKTILQAQPDSDAKIDALVWLGHFMVVYAQNQKEAALLFMDAHRSFAALRDNEGYIDTNYNRRALGRYLDFLVEDELNQLDGQVKDVYQNVLKNAQAQDSKLPDDSKKQEALYKKALKDLGKQLNKIK